MTFYEKLLHMADMRLELELEEFSKKGLLVYADFCENLEKFCKKYKCNEDEIIAICKKYFKANKREFKIAYLTGFKDCYKIINFLNKKGQSKRNN